MSINEHYKVNPVMILRGTELFNRSLGIGFYSPCLIDKYQNISISDDEPNIIWLPSETAELMERVNQHGSVLIKGEPGAGKSALVYGLRSLMRLESKSYCYIDGHYLTSPQDKILAAITWAERNNAPVIWDSLDYLIAASRRVRKNKLSIHLNRSETLLDALISFVDSNTLIGTTHCDQWIATHCNPILFLGKWDELMRLMMVHEVRGIFDNSQEIIQFYKEAGFTGEEADYLASLAERDDIAYLLQRMERPKQMVGEIVVSVRQYRIAKLLALGQDETSGGVRESLKKYLQGEIDEEFFLEIYADFVVQKNVETQKKRGQRFNY